MLSTDDTVKSIGLKMSIYNRHGIDITQNIFRLPKEAG